MVSKKNRTNTEANVPIIKVAGTTPIQIIRTGVNTLKKVMGSGPSIIPGQISAANVKRNSFDMVQFNWILRCLAPVAKIPDNVPCVQSILNL